MSAGNIIAVVAAGVAIAAVIVGWLQTNTTLRQNRELADLEVVRSVLDEAVVGLLKASKQIAEIHELRERPEELEPAWEAANQAGDSIAAELERLKVRFGLEHPIVKSFARAVAACSEITTAADGMISRGVHFDSAERGAARRAELAARRKHGVGVIEHQSECFETERGRFLEAAHALTGAKLKRSGGSAIRLAVRKWYLAVRGSTLGSARQRG